jgi:hypothetical protein
MTDGEWRKVTPREWRYERPYPNRWVPEAAHVVLRRKGEWALYVNGVFIGTFSSWEEARDAAPMMLSLHGYNAQNI